MAGVDVHTMEVSADSEAVCLVAVDLVAASADSEAACPEVAASAEAGDVWAADRCLMVIW